MIRLPIQVLAFVLSWMLTGSSVIASPPGDSAARSNDPLVYIESMIEKSSIKESASAQKFDVLKEKIRSVSAKDLPIYELWGGPVIVGLVTLLNERFHFDPNQRPSEQYKVFRNELSNLILKDCETLGKELGPLLRIYYDQLRGTRKVKELSPTASAWIENLYVCNMINIFQAYQVYLVNFVDLEPLLKKLKATRGRPMPFDETLDYLSAAQAKEQNLADIRELARLETSERQCSYWYFDMYFRLKQTYGESVHLGPLIDHYLKEYAKLCVPIFKKSVEEVVKFVWDDKATRLEALRWAIEEALASEDQPVELVDVVNAEHVMAGLVNYFTSIGAQRLQGRISGLAREKIRGFARGNCVLRSERQVTLKNFDRLSRALGETRSEVLDQDTLNWVTTIKICELLTEDSSIDYDLVERQIPISDTEDWSTVQATWREEDD